MVALSLSALTKGTLPVVEKMVIWSWKTSYYLRKYELRQQQSFTVNSQLKKQKETPAWNNNNSSKEFL